MNRRTDFGGWSRRAVIRLALGGLLCASCADPAALEIGRAGSAIEIGPELDVGPATLVAAAGAQFTQGPIRAGDHYLVPWIDTRRSWPSEAFLVDRDLIAARVTDDGTVLDPVGFTVIGGPGAVLHTSSGACDDDGLCLVVAGAGQGFTGPIVGVRVVDDQVLDPTPLVIADGASLAAQRAVAWDGQQFRVVYSQAGAVVSATVSTAGAVGETVAVGLDGFDQTLGCGGTRCLVVASTQDLANRFSVGRLLDPTGPAGEPFVITDPAASAPNPPTIVWDGARYWLDYEEAVGTQNRLYLVRVSAEGLVLDPSGITVATGTSAAQVGGVGLGRSDDELLVTWERTVTFPFHRSIRVTRVQLDGTILDPDGVEIGTTSFGVGMKAPILACGPSACLGITHEGADTSVRGYRLDGTTSLDPSGFDISTAPAGQTEASAAYHGGRYVVAWRDARPSSNSPFRRSIRGVLFPPTMDSFVTFGTAAVLEGPRSSNCLDAREPRVAASATSVMVAWFEECIPSKIDDSYVQAFGLDGQPLGPALEVGNRNGRDSHPMVASNGSEFVVLWDYQEPQPPRSIQMRRYGANGAPLTERVQWNRNGFAPVAVFDGTNYLVVWRRPLSTQESRPDVFAGRMAPDGTALDEPIPVATLPNIPEDAHSAACGGGVCLVAWRHAAIQVRAVRLGLDGTVLDAAPMIFPTDGPVPATSIAFDGQAFLLAWETETHEMHGAQITPAGEIIAPGDLLIAAADPTARGPLVVSNGGGHLIEIHERYDASPATLMRRLRARVIGTPPTGDPDYVVAALGDPPAAAISGATFSVGVTVRNGGGPSSASSTTRFFLSADTVVGGDRALTRTATVPPLAAGASDAQTISLQVPSGLPGGAYFLLACADRGADVPESDERNNCRASAATVTVTGPDLVVDAVVDPPATLVVGQSFPAGDTTRNAGTATAASSGVAYYLSPVPARGPGARRLSTTRPTGPIAAGSTSSGQVSVKVPALDAGTYYLVACADISSAVAELDEGNNCAAAAGTTSVGPPALAPPPAGFSRTGSGSSR